MRWNSGFSSVLLISVMVFLLVALVSTEARLRKRKFDGDFEFADEEETKSNRKEGKKTWILDPGSDLCQALKCKKKELCLLEDEFTAVCVSKKELHKNGDVIIPKSKLKESTSAKLDETDSKEYDEDEDDDSDYYDDDDDSDEDLLPNTASSSSSNNNNNKLDKTSGSAASNGLPASSSDLLNSASGNSFK
ncbi:unnamed protein product [Orchesella dallaii]|uniref:Uncharacterized protein n=1 Tax=Orchesella dallaii TaxID=48710 RepID=A0ABP1QDV7_9HEXA